MNFNELFMAPALAKMYLSLINFCFMAIFWSFIIFLIPYQLYNYFMKRKQQDSKILTFKSFLKVHLWPVVIETLKAFCVVMAYAGVGLTVWVIFFLTSVFFIEGLRAQMQELAVLFMTLMVATNKSLNVKNFIEIIMEVKAIVLLFMLSFVCLIPSIIKGIQYIIVPFVVIFNKSFPIEKTSLKISERLSRGLVLPFFLLFLFFYLIHLFLPFDIWIKGWAGEQNVLTPAYVKILFGSLKYIFYTGFFCMVYFNQDKIVFK